MLIALIKRCFLISSAFFLMFLAAVGRAETNSILNSAEFARQLAEREFKPLLAGITSESPSAYAGRVIDEIQQPVILETITTYDQQGKPVRQSEQKRPAPGRQQLLTNDAKNRILASINAAIPEREYLALSLRRKQEIQVTIEVFGQSLISPVPGMVPDEDLKAKLDNLCLRLRQLKVLPVIIPREPETIAGQLNPLIAVLASNMVMRCGIPISLDPYVAPEVSHLLQDRVCNYAADTATANFKVPLPASLYHNLGTEVLEALPSEPFTQPWLEPELAKKLKALANDNSTNNKISQILSEDNQREQIALDLININLSRSFDQIINTYLNYGVSNDFKDIQFSGGISEKESEDNGRAMQAVVLRQFDRVKNWQAEQTKAFQLEFRREHPAGVTARHHSEKARYYVLAAFVVANMFAILWLLRIRKRCQ